jgi:nitrite reductase/ring-hydroxylating ferredoxin subunit
VTIADLFEVVRLDKAPPGTGKDVALFNVDETIYAMEDSYCHQGLSLRTGKLDGKVVTCRGERMAVRRDN